MRDVNDDFEFVKEIGKGGFATIFLCKDKYDSKAFAIKSIIKAKVLECSPDYKEIVSEIKIMKALDHPYIIKLYKIYESDTHVHLVLDYLEGGDLAARLKTRPFYSEENSAKIIMRLLSILNYLHKNNITHRDIKLENLVLVSKYNDFDFKLLDFGLSVMQIKNINDRCGSNGYIAPEINKCRFYDNKVDLYSAGVVLYCLLSGILPNFVPDLNLKDSSISHNYKLNFEGAY